MTAVNDIYDKLPRWANMWLLADGLFAAGKACVPMNARRSFGGGQRSAPQIER